MIKIGLVLSVIAILIEVSFIILVLLYQIANFVKPLQKLYCKLGWHCHAKDCIPVDEFCDDHSKDTYECKWCKAICKSDSTGQLYE